MGRFATRFKLQAAVSPRSGGGRSRKRAVDGDDKEARRQVMLDAAERLFAERQGLANVADVADAAGLAKGTVYLYFQSKEEIYLALHLRQAESFLGELVARLDEARPFGFEQLQALVKRHILDAPTYLPLSACCIGFASGSVSAPASAHFEARLGAALQAAGAGLERHYPRLAAGEGPRLLRHSYAIMLGLYCLLRSGGPRCAPADDQGSFQREAALALARYWTQVAGIDAPAAKLNPRGK